MKGSVFNKNISPVLNNPSFTIVPANWPAGIIYGPDNSGKPLTSLGVHESWNNADDKRYSCNPGTSNGIELVSIPETLVKTKSLNK